MNSKNFVATLSDESKGLLLALLSAVSAAAFIVPYKMAISDGHGAGSVLLLLAGAAVFNSIASIGLLRGRLRLESYGFAVALVMAVFTVLGNWGSMRAIAELHPAVASALLQGQVLYVALAGYFILRERVSLGYWLGAGCALLGIFLLRVPLDSTATVSTSGLLYVNLAAFCFGMLHVVTRKTISRIEPVGVNAVRLWLSVAALAAIPTVRSAATQLSARQLLLTLVAAFLGPFLARVALMYSARYVSASRAILFALSSPIFALLFSWLLLGTLPSAVELFGCSLVLVGILVPLARRAKTATDAAP